MKKMYKVLTFEDLMKALEEKKMKTFDSKKEGYKLCVQVPTTFEEEDVEDSSRAGLMRVKIKVMHLGRNRNGSSVSEKSAKKAFASFKNRPVLGAIHQLENGEWDFDAHNREVVTNENGEEEIHYIEQQIGSFTEETPFFEYDKEQDKTYVCAYAVIPEDYTKAAEIIRRKNGTKNSCELCINELSYDAKNKTLNLNDWYLNASTFLGTDSDGEPVDEGMLGSRADIVDFSVENNSVMPETFEEKVLEKLENISTALSNFQINTKSKEGGNETLKLKELLEKYSKTMEDITFETEGLSDEELEAKFQEVFGDTPSEEDEVNAENMEKDETEEVPEEMAEEPSKGETEETEEPEIEENTVHNTTKKFSININNKDYLFESSLDETIYALETVINNTYAEADNAYYGAKVYDKYVVMIDYYSGKAYKQNYKKRNDVYSLTGDRVEVFARYLTREEEQTIDDMRNKYSAAEEKLNKYIAKENAEMKEVILESEDYEAIRESEEFTEFAEDVRAEGNEAKYSVEDVQKKCDDMLLSYAKSKAKFSAGEKKTAKKYIRTNAEKEEGYKPYGHLFDGYKN